MSALLGALRCVPARATGLAVGFSGGLDSTALLHVISRQLPGALPIRAIHVCHHLQPQAEAWAMRCAAQCSGWRVACTRIDVQVVNSGQGTEAAARAARYGAIASALSPGEVLVTAHHAGDQAETFLLQALRGAGMKGLAAMPAYSDFGPGGHWRPWLGVDRDDIQSYACANTLEWIQDPSNTDPDIDRSYLRTRILPEVAARWPAFARTLSRSAAHAGAAADAIDARAATDLIATDDGYGALRCDALARLDKTRQSEVIRRWLVRAGAERADHRHLEQIRGLLDARMTASPCVHFADTDVRRFDDRLFCMPTLAPAPDAAGARLDWQPTRTLDLPNGCGTLAMDAPRADMPPLQVGFRRGGEKLVTGAGTHQRLKKNLNAARIAPWIRERMPLVYSGAELIAVADHWRHPQIERLLDGPVGMIRWQHGLVGGYARVVAAPPFG